MDAYEKKYKEALNKAKKELNTCGSQDCDAAKQIFRLFPELKESEDEKVRKVLFEFFKNYKEQGTCGSETFNGIPTDNILAWLEKQGEQNPAGKVEPKFKVGDFIVNDYCMGKVIELTGDAYLLDTGQGIPFSCEHNAHLWTIADAKDGDALVSSSGKPFIFHGFFDNDPMAYGGLVADDSFWPASNSNWTTAYCKPATKEQCDLLFQKMHEAGYEWNVEKKKLKKIEQKSQRYDKLAWSEKDDMMIEETLYFLREYQQSNRCKDENGMQNSVSCEKWLKSLKERLS